MTGRVLMVQGTASSAGKSVLVAGLCRILRQDGLRVAPFKSQNMALNSYVTIDEGEIGRAQAMQAEAAGAEMTVDMNPILLKPEADSRCQVVVMGKPWANLRATEYYQRKPQLWSIVTDSLDRLRSQYDIIIAEGAGSPAEINLRQGDIVNMQVALYAQAPVLLVGDIDRGGVFAALVGTHALISDEERALVKGLVINKFRGDISLLEPGLRMVEDRIGVPVVGVVPYFRDIRLPDEDSVALDRRQPVARTTGQLDVAIIRLPHISNFDDFDPLEHEPGVHLRYVEDVASLGQPDLIILPGTKTTIADLTHLRTNGLAAVVQRLAREGIPVVGICGGYQMLGERILDPLHVESSLDETSGLGLLPANTIFAARKHTRRVRGVCRPNAGVLEGCVGLEVAGYEIHMGETTGQVAPLIDVHERSGRPVSDTDGAASQDGMVFGTYLHGLFANDGFRHSLLAHLQRRAGVASSDSAAAVFSQDAEYDKLAALLRRSLDMPYIYGLLGLR